MTGCPPIRGCANPEHRQTTELAIDERAPLCAVCLTAASRDIAALTLDFRDLSMRIGTSTAPVQGGRVGGSSELVVPLRLDVDELVRDIAWQLAVWEPPVREAARLPPERTRGVRLGWAVATAVEVIAPRVDVLAALPLTWGYADGMAAGPVERDGVDAVVRLVALHRRARFMLGLTSLVTRLPGDCSGCGSLALQREDGSEQVDCAVCGQRWTLDDYRRYVGMIVAANEGQAIRQDH